MLWTRSTGRADLPGSGLGLDVHRSVPPAGLGTDLRSPNRHPVTFSGSLTHGVAMAVARAHPGVNSNLLADDERYDELSGNAVLNGTPVKVAPAVDPAITGACSPSWSVSPST